MVYYFRANVRCAACRTLEACSREVVASDFAAEAADGRIQWRAIDYQSPGNEHFLTDYQLLTGGVVLVEFRDGRPQRWTALPETWNMTGDRKALARYLEEAIDISPPSMRRRPPRSRAMNLQEPSAAMAFGLGLWTAVQPCPMTANLAAVSYLGRRAGSPGSALFAALLYAAGQMIAYVVPCPAGPRRHRLGLAAVGVVATTRQPDPRAGLDPDRNGPAGPDSFRLPGVRVGPKWQSKIDAWGAWSALPLGIVLALGFCPVSATIFFVDLLTIAAERRDPTSSIRRSTPWARRCPYWHLPSCWAPARGGWVRP